MDIPGWFVELPANASLNAPDVQRLFGFTYAALNYRVRHGKFPPHDWEATRHWNNQRTRQWYVSTIRKHIESTLKEMR